ncbi:MAG: c-type cytochrome domain-containing protein, partial [Verrucomicrobiales bacterium]
MTLLTRTHHFAAASLVGGALLFQGVSASAEEPRKLDPANDQAYEHVIKPILAATCTGCHGEKKDKGKIRLHTPDDIRDADVIVEGQSADSELTSRIMLPEDDEDVMPPAKKGKPLGDKEIDLIKRWI